MADTNGNNGEIGPAQKLVADTYTKHSHKAEPIDIRSTEGLQRMCLANKAAVERLAAFVDGNAEPVEPARMDLPNYTPPSPPVRQTA